MAAALLCALAVPLLTGLSQANDWPAWRGPNRDGICQEKGLLKEWPKEGPKLLWKATGLGIGFGGPAVVGDVLYIMGGNDDKEWVLALDTSRQGKQLWASPIGPIRNEGGGHPGPRSTPTIDGDRLYTLGIAGDLVSMDIKDGRILWRHDLVKDFGGRIPHWGYAESVLVDGPWVVCTPGGAKNTIVALDKTNGQARLGLGGRRSGRLLLGHQSHDRRREAVRQPDEEGRDRRGGQGRQVPLALRRPGQQGGQRAPPASGRTTRSSPPAATAPAAGWCGFNPSGDGFTAKEVYFTKKMENHHGGLILRDGVLYGVQQSAGPPHLPGLQHRQSEMDRPQFGQVLAAVGRRAALLPQRERADQPGRGHAGGVQAQGPVRPALPQPAEQLAPPGHRQRRALPPRPGRAAGVRRAGGEVRGGPKALQFAQPSRGASRKLWA